MLFHIISAISLLCLFGDFVNASPGDENYVESLKLRPLRDGKLAARFAFTILLNNTVPRAPSTLNEDDIPQHYTLFPLALGQILREYAITELHLNLNAGQWDYDRWGHPDHPAVGSGAELWAWIGDGGPMSVDTRWKGAQNALAGLFCASLGSMNEQRTTSPTRAFPPSGALPRLPSPHKHQLRHATLPSEVVCTENLTPFAKLLPCPAQAGVASLLNPHRLFDADWHGLGVDVRWIAGRGVELTMTVQAVFDPVRMSPEARRDWTFRSVFGRTVSRVCPVASQSQVIVELPADGEWSLFPVPSEMTDTVATYNLTTGMEELDISMKWPQEPKFVYPLGLASSGEAALSLSRALKGTSQTHGELVLTVKNNRNAPERVLWLEALPWHVELYLHTLHVYCSDGRRCDELLGNWTYTPPVPHAAPALLQAELFLPSGERIQTSARVRKSFLRYTEHPPDSHRGWDLPPAVLTLASAPRMYTRSLLVDLATPDFSMPYNVIIMTCTLIALVFGSVLNILTRRFTIVDLDAGRFVTFDDKQTSAPGEQVDAD